MCLKRMGYLMVGVLTLASVVYANRRVIRRLYRINNLYRRLMRKAKRLSGKTFGAEANVFKIHRLRRAKNGHLAKAH